ncbi:endonuclease/exonuclease/phosphatase family protein [Paraclostridium ghonii]|uniref:endonuclease/exonuclease/phosphatase family protein n=1 Tax=Paraclostridium ghonii TaxID=29358 RepID=UPI00202CCF84|nr:endonuclease/exonuclease/phosphatase family protein [Paeniclostridium ghonii]MCM0167093.1 endonuclease/exonuclease/phosphatase family protein [Paeniclostridium ghonii]
MKIITYNIHKGMDEFNKNTLEELISFLKKSKADIICLQEVLESIHYKIINDLNIEGHFLSTVKLKNDNYGIAVYFNEHINYTQEFYLPSKKEQRGFVHIEFFFNNKLANIINTHLGLNEEERKKQLDEISIYADKLRGKTIICGDFNELNVKINNYYDLAILFDCENVETFKPSKSRIDYIFMSKNLNATKYKVEFINLSDHYPVIGEFII